MLPPDDLAVVGAAHVVSEFRRTGSVPAEVVRRIQAKALLRSGRIVPTVQVEKRLYEVLARMVTEIEVREAADAAAQADVTVAREVG